jgi:hypothetical protein
MGLHTWNIIDMIEKFESKNNNEFVFLDTNKIIFVYFNVNELHLVIDGALVKLWGDIAEQVYRSYIRRVAIDNPHLNFRQI